MGLKKNFDLYIILYKKNRGLSPKFINKINNKMNFISFYIIFKYKKNLYNMY